LAKTKNIESLNAVEEDEGGFIDGAVDVGKPIATFSFASPPAAAAPLRSGKNFFTPRQRGATPAVAGEDFTLVHSYKLRPSNHEKAQRDQSQALRGAMVICQKRKRS
jgi:hypothetical protein